MRLAKEALTFDDVLLVPAHSTVLPSETSLQTRLTRGIALNVPLLAAAMDTVTEGRLAITMAQEGGASAGFRGREADCATAREPERPREARSLRERARV